jgi:protein-tyrosine phosphatase
MTSQNVWGWFEQATNQAKELAAQAQVQAQYAAAELSKQATELQKTYNSEMVSSILASEGKQGAPLTEEDRQPRKGVRVEDIDFTYVTENLVGMGFPFSPEKRKSKRGNDIRDVSGYLQEKHNGHFMIWNISEDAYDYSFFGDQVLEYKFPGHPAPPLGLMFKMCTSMESWLDADERNIAILHCLTGKGRTAVVLACVLTWIGEFSSPMEALNYVAIRKHSNVDALTIPSQRRYIQYFSNVLDGVRPRAEPLLLRRVIMNGIPRYGQSDADSDADTSGCCPYLQLFKNGRIIANAVMADTSSSSSANRLDDGSQWVRCAAGSVSFQVDCMVQGDLLLRCRHHDKATGARVSMFRTAFHTGYVPSGVLRLTKAQLDGPNTDDRYSDEFFIDLIFAPVEKSAAPAAAAAAAAASDSEENPSAGASDSGVLMDPALTDKFEQMLHRDARFWESVGARKARAKRRRARKFVSESPEKFSICDDSGRSPLTSASSRGGGNHLSDDEDEVSFSRKPAVESGGGVGGISDEELIKQLAEAEADEDSSSWRDVGVEESSDFAMSDSDKKSSVSAPPSASASASGAGKPAAASSSSSAKKELDALEELERELGLDLGSSSTAPATSASSAVPAGASASGGAAGTAGGDDLDDLEAFLESLNTK